MRNSPYKVAAILHSARLSQDLYQQLLDNGFESGQLVLLRPEMKHQHDKIDRSMEPETAEVAHEIVKDTLVGTGAGAAAGAVGSAALAVGEVALFLTNPVMAAVAISSYTAVIGGLLGGIRGFRMRESDFISKLKEALDHGAWVLIVHTRTREQQYRAEDLIQDSGAIQSRAS